MSERNRVSVTLSDIEMQRIDAIALQMGLKPTKLVYMAVSEGLPIILQRHTSMLNNVVVSVNLQSDSGYVKKPVNQHLKQQHKRGKNK